MTPALSARMLRLGGVFPAGTALATIAYEYSLSPVAAALAGALAVAGVAVFSIADRRTPVVFVFVGLALIAVALAMGEGAGAAIWTAVQRGSFVVALYTALTSIRIAATGSHEILDCGRFLASQPPGRRYVALTAGGHLFGLILLYGSIGLLGGLAAESTAREPNPELRQARLRRMLVAINRGFASTLCWSPLGFSMAITTALIPGASWSAALLPCLLNAAVLLLLGWLLDSLFKPRLTQAAPPRQAPSGGWLLHLRPLLILLSVVIAGVSIIHFAAGVDVIGAVMSFVPAVAVVWIWLQGGQSGNGRWGHLARRMGMFVTRELPAYGSQIVLLFMAAFIGSLGSWLLVPLMGQLGLDLTALSPAVILVALVWLMPLTGQLGMNPILSASLILPMLPAADQLGVPAAALVAAVTGGWAISGATSPYTASVLLMGSYGNVSARRAGLVWNGAYALVTSCVISVLVLLYATWG
ncbi:hypothetical protein [Paracoccus shanxieyensis]|uniref:Uncharacterized protein n=1 Tax=Paracoccus shanxieyensis TaxID=2675752 RepID=A0A6L6J007_9RHOB|nr:hypothetical protein [Paracoccus shanxieyensis]MTH64164.1 hypothetical protein [Paracoccus shanxieyensis]MTH87308.1 hypothetical protein [Paracoccus shanxieyensis]